MDRRAKSGRTASPRLERLEGRLALAADTTVVQMIPTAGDRFTLRIDLAQHGRGDDGLPDTVFISRAPGLVEVVLVGRQPETLYRDDAGQVSGVELLGSGDTEFVLLDPGFDLPFTFDAAEDDRVVRIGKPVVVPEPVVIDAPPEDEIADYIEDPLPVTQEREDAPSELLVVVRAPARPTTVPLVIDLPEDEQFSSEPQDPPPVEARVLVPPEMLGGKPVDDSVRIRTPSGGGHRERDSAATEGAPLPQEEEVG